MAYIVQRKDRFYVVDYDGIDPITGRERRRWRLVGCDRTEAEELTARLEAERADAQPRRSPTSLSGFLLETWLPRKRAHVRATTQYRYTWIVQHYLLPVHPALSAPVGATITDTAPKVTSSAAT